MRFIYEIVLDWSCGIFLLLTIFLLVSSPPQGLQRRIAVTIVHESGGDLEWRDIRELVVGELPLILIISLGLGFGLVLF